jgi:protein-S-isoprenylcysteine O-methyltransferase Ste14
MSAGLGLLALGWAAYGALHSALIAPGTTRYLKRGLGGGFRFYRLFFNLVAVASLVPLVSYARSLEGPASFRWQGPLLGVRYALQACGVLLFLAGARHYSLAQFLGVGQLRGTTRGGLVSGGGIDSSGVLGLVRHPWYTGLLLLLWARDLDASRLVTGAVLTAYVVVGTLLEERKLVAEFGETYARYQATVSMFLPFAWLRRRLAAGGPAAS